MQDLFNKILDSIKRNNACAVTTVVSSYGSAPRKIGAKMVVLKDGTIMGTIGGGKLEKLVISDAKSALRRKKSYLKDYPLDKKSGLQVCGGGVSIFIETVIPRKRLFIAGGGHIGLALSFVAKLLNFNIVVLDNRRDFANKKRFPHADRIICDSYKSAFKKITCDKNSFIVIITHGHAHDSECLESALKSDAGYVGMIGSKTKIKLVFNSLKKLGFSNSKLSSVYTPVGLDIGAQTPEEIAVAIGAELIKVQQDKMK